MSLRSRAVVFAVCAGGVSFILALCATTGPELDADSFGRALILAIVCAAMSWASAERSLSSTAAAIDSAIERLVQAAEGDLESPIPPGIGACVPQLAGAMEGLFARFGANLESAQKLAMFDPVTDLPNRLHFRRTAERMLAEMPHDRCAALLFIDLDRFKAVNDTMGHASGDMLLALVASRLHAVAERAAANGTAPHALIGRLAGDEFTMFFPDLSDPQAAARIARRTLLTLGQPYGIAGGEIEIGASIGIAVRPDHGATLTDLMRAADLAMYHAKASGRGRAEYFTEDLAAGLANRARLEADLRDAIDQRQFALVFQPQLDLATGRTVAAEALLRWRHPQDGLRLPGTFIQRAEETGLIVEIGDWVIGEVAATIARWSRIGVEQRLAINISQRQLDHAHFFRRLRAAMQASDAPARLLELEITETMATHCSGEVLEAIEALRHDGATIAIDDFGTGYSNLSQMRTLPIDRVKLDRSVIEHVTTREDARTIAQALVQLIHGLGWEAVAEGIETPAQAEVLRVIGCDAVQGFAVAAPMAEGAFLAWSRGLDEMLRA